MLRITLILAKSRNTRRDNSIQGKQHQTQARRISWQIAVRNGWVRKQQPAHKVAQSSPRQIPDFLPSSKFYTIFCGFTRIPAAGSCLLILCAGVLGSLWHTHVCVRVVCVVAPRITDPTGGRSGIVSGFLVLLHTAGAKLGKWCLWQRMKARCPRLWFCRHLPHHEPCHSSVQTAFFLPPFHKW